MKAAQKCISVTGTRIFFALIIVAASVASGAVFYTETFSSDLSGWVDRDAGKMGDTWSSGFGNPGGSDKGTFAAQVFPSPQNDAWRATASSSSGKFAGDYWTKYLGFTGFRFDFYAANVLPSDLTLRIGNGANTFALALLPLNTQIQTTGVWYTVSVPLDYVYPWLGGTPIQFTNVLSNVTFVDVQVSRNGKNAQSYYLDNFRLVDELIFVPEPASGLFWFGWALVFGGLRRKLTGRRERSPYALPAAAIRSVP